MCIAFQPAEVYEAVGWLWDDGLVERHFDFARRTSGPQGPVRHRNSQVQPLGSRPPERVGNDFAQPQARSIYGDVVSSPLGFRLSLVQKIVARTTTALRVVARHASVACEANRLMRASGGSYLVHDIKP